MSKYKVTIFPQSKIVEVEEDRPLLFELKKEGIYIKSSCGGVASCSDCIIKIRMGAENLNPPSFEESKLLGNVFHLTKERLSCQTKIHGDIEIDISNHDLSTDQNKLKKKSTQFRIGGTKIKKKSEINTPSFNNKERSSSDQAEPKWFKHWEKKKDGPKDTKTFSQGGGGKKRPKAFRSDSED